MPTQSHATKDDVQAIFKKIDGLRDDVTQYHLDFETYRSETRANCANHIARTSKLESMVTGKNGGGLVSRMQTVEERQQTHLKSHDATRSERQESRGLWIGVGGLIVAIIAVVVRYCK